MELYKKNRLVFWVLIFLVIVNLSALVTFLIYQQNKPKTEGCSNMSPGSSFREELNLTVKQSEKITSINNRQREIAEPIVEAIKEKRSEIVEELSKKLPDTAALSLLAFKLSGLQYQLQRANIRQYLELKTVVTAEQAQKLSALYRELYGCPMKEKGMQYKHRNGKMEKGCENN
jgi:Spy/CpxP family protein refolding chaperone